MELELRAAYIDILVMTQIYLNLEVGFVLLSLRNNHGHHHTVFLLDIHQKVGRCKFLNIFCIELFG